jgi:hypothetical protein
MVITSKNHPSTLMMLPATSSKASVHILEYRASQTRIQQCLKQCMLSMPQLCSCPVKCNTTNQLLLVVIDNHDHTEYFNLFLLLVHQNNSYI